MTKSSDEDRSPDPRRREAIALVESLIFEDRQDTPHSMAITIVDALITKGMMGA